MRFPLSWIRDFVPLPDDLEKVASGFTFSGTEVEEIIREDGETVFDFGFTVNRPDLMSVFGLAREASAIFSLPFPSYVTNVPKGSFPVEQIASVEVKDPGLCPRYRALVIKGAKVGQSPPAVQRRLSSCGLRPINAVVDATNYVLMEYGHPLHAFDCRHLRGGRIVVRRAVEGEKIILLDGSEKKLSSKMLVIADAERPLAVAGVMGGEESGVTFTTKDILLEGAVFDPASIRRTSKELGLHTDASHRFERGTDLEGPVKALERAAELILETCGGELCLGALDVIAQAPPPPEIPFRPARLEKLLGMKIDDERAFAVLRSLGFSVSPGADGTFSVRCPSFRVDVSREADLIEEIVRIEGLDKLPSTTPQGIDAESGRTHSQSSERLARNFLASQGLMETVHFSMADPALDALFEGAGEPLRIANPLSESASVLRRNLLSNMLLTASRNASYGNRSFGLFETGNAYLPDVTGGVAERQRLALLGYEEDAPRSHATPRRRDLLALKGILGDLFAALGRNVSFAEKEAELPVFSKAHFLEILSDKDRVGFLGYLDPWKLRDLGLKGRTAVAEISSPGLFSRTDPSFRPFSRFPGSRRDIAVQVSREAKWIDVYSAVTGAGAKNLSSAELVEVYEGERVPHGMRSVTVGLNFQALDRTLSDAEVEEDVRTILARLENSIGAILR